MVWELLERGLMDLITSCQNRPEPSDREKMKIKTKKIAKFKAGFKLADAVK